jgi:hypothetical protein
VDKLNEKTAFRENRRGFNKKFLQKFASFALLQSLVLLLIICYPS